MNGTVNYTAYNNNILIFFESALDTRPGFRKPRLRFVDLLVKIWLRFIFRLLIFPEEVNLNVFRAPLCDFIFGITIPYFMIVLVLFLVPV